MYFSDFVSLLRRRWYVVICGVLVTTLAMLLMSQLAPPQYRATTTLIMMPPDATEDSAKNPYVQLGLSATGTAVARVLAGQNIAEELKATDLSTAFEVSLVPDSPIVLISVADPDPTVASDSASEVASIFLRELEAIQRNASAPDGALIFTQHLTQTDEPVVERGNQIRAMAAVLALGSAGTLGFVFLVEFLTSRRLSHDHHRPDQSQHSAGPGDPAHGGTGGGPADPAHGGTGGGPADPAHGGTGGGPADPAHGGTGDGPADPAHGGTGDGPADPAHGGTGDGWTDTDTLMPLHPSVGRGIATRQ
jgi:capsular polysaccharide biosynthesis protein